MITLTKSQQMVVDRLKALPGAYEIKVTETRTLYGRSGRTTRSLAIYGGFRKLGTVRECGHSHGSAHRQEIFEWVDGKYQPRGRERYSGLEYRLARLEREAAVS